MKKQDKPLTDYQTSILNYIANNEPLNCIENQEHFVRRITQVYSVEDVMNSLREIIVYCASHPKWEQTRSQGNMARTVTNWLRRARENKGVGGSFTLNIHSVPQKQNEGELKKEAVNKLGIL